MKTLEKIEKEYKDFNIKSDYINSIEELEQFLFVGLFDADEEVDIVKKYKKNNYKRIRIGKIYNLFSFNNKVMIEFFEEDNKILDEFIKLAEDYRDYFANAIESVNKDNYKEILKLTDFSIDYYNQNIAYLEGKRDSLEYLFKGIQYLSGKEDNRSVIAEFQKKKLQELSNNKEVEKTKKI